MKLGYLIGAWSGAEFRLPLERIRLVEDLGYDSVWSSEAYGADALTPLAYLAAVTDRIKLGTAVVQIGARTPAATAMAFSTIEAMAGRGRVIAGLGLSGPQIVEGWYGTPWPKPIARTRDTVAIMRRIFARDAAVEYEGESISLPLRSPDALGVGKPLKSIMHTNPDLPIHIAAGGPANVALTAEVADGWITMGMNPSNAHEFRPALERGAARSGRSLDTLEVSSGCSVRITDDVAGTLEAMKPQTAFFVGGYGTKDHNFHRDAMIRRGYRAEAERIQELFIAGRRDEAAATVPDEYLDDGGLFGSPKRIEERLQPWLSCGITSLTVNTAQDEALELMADLVGTERTTRP